MLPNSYCENSINYSDTTTGDKYPKKRKQANILYKYRCTNPLWNTSRQNSGNILKRISNVNN